MDYAGLDHEHTTITVYTSGKVWNKVKKKVLDERDLNSKEFGKWLRSKLLPKGGRAKIDSYGNVYLRGKLTAELDYVPLWAEEKKSRRSLNQILEDL
jgi:hypothetical protein